MSGLRLGAKQLVHLIEAQGGVLARVATSLSSRRDPGVTSCIPRRLSIAGPAPSPSPFGLDLPADAEALAPDVGDPHRLGPQWYCVRGIVTFDEEIFTRGPGNRVVLTTSWSQLAEDRLLDEPSAHAHVVAKGSARYDDLEGADGWYRERNAWKAIRYLRDEVLDGFALTEEMRVRLHAVLAEHP